MHERLKSGSLFWYEIENESLVAGLFERGLAQSFDDENIR
jgi:hypothetical protein